MTWSSLDLNRKTLPEHSTVFADNIDITVNAKIIFLMVEAESPLKFIFDQPRNDGDASSTCTLC